MHRRNVRVYVNDFAFKTAAPLFRLMITADKDVSSAWKRGAELAKLESGNKTINRVSSRDSRLIYREIRGWGREKMVFRDRQVPAGL